MADDDRAPVEDDSNFSDFIDDVGEEHDDRSSGTDEEEYVDPHAADYMDFPEGNDIEELHVSANEEEPVA